MTPEDEQRIEKAANRFGKLCDPFNQTIEKQADLRLGYITGATSEHPIARAQGRKEVLEELREKIVKRYKLWIERSRTGYFEGSFYDVIIPILDELEKQ